jgi:pSer/pThr/pTyr-binding forkhead associated (FHA) protein
VFCTNCGHQNPTDANFCSSCGSPLASAGEDVTITFNVADLGLGEQTEDELSVQLKELSPNDAMLLVKRGPNVGARYLLDSDVVRAGRHPDNEIFLDDVTVSRWHAEFRRDNAHFVLQDVGSLNGTYLNGDRIDSARVRRGDEVQIGKFKLVFLAGTDS